MWFIKKKEINETKGNLIPDFDNFKEVEHISILIQYIKNPDDRVAKPAAQTINRLFQTIKKYELNLLYTYFKYLDLKVNDIQKLKRFEKDVRIPILCISTFNSNGFVREKALSKLVKLKSYTIIPFVLFRLSDWVPSIKSKAERKIKKLCKVENTIFFIQNHKLLDWMLKVQRNDLSQIYSLIIRTIASTKLDSTSIFRLDEGERFFYYNKVSNSGLIDRSMLRLLINDKYSLIRFLAFKHLDIVKKSKTIILMLLNDSNPRIRENAICLLSDKDINDYKSVLENLVFDSSSFVRNHVRNMLEKVDDYDFYSMYKDNLINDKFLVGSILGLSEVSDKNAIIIIEKFLKYPQAKVLSASLIGINNLDEKIGREISYVILENNYPSSSKKVAEKILSRTKIDYQRLRSLYDLTDITGRKIILRLFSRFKSWAVAGDYLKALGDKDDSIRLMAKNYLESWNHYTISFCTKQTDFDREYVMKFYNENKIKGINSPNDIPFIFRKI